MFETKKPSAPKETTNTKPTAGRNFSLAACMSVNKERLEQLPTNAKSESEMKKDKIKVFKINLK